MILRIILFILLFLFLLIFLYPLRLTFSFSNEGEKAGGRLLLHPLFMLRSVAVTLFDTERPKKEKKKKEKKKRKKGKEEEDKKETKKKKKTERKMMPINELILEVINLIGKFKRRVKRLRLSLSLYYGFPDPARTGEITGLLYATLPPLSGDIRKCKWKLRMEPLWQVEKTSVGVYGEFSFNVLGTLITFIPMLPDVIKLLPKKVKNTEVEK